jgi:hypothetical protein
MKRNLVDKDAFHSNAVSNREVLAFSLRSGAALGDIELEVIITMRGENYKIVMP